VAVAVEGLELVLEELVLEGSEEQVVVLEDSEDPVLEPLVQEVLVLVDSEVVLVDLVAVAVEGLELVLEELVLEDLTDQGLEFSVDLVCQGLREEPEALEVLALDPQGDQLEFQQEDWDGGPELESLVVLEVVVEHQDH